MKKFAGTLVSFVFVFFLATSNLWAGDAEIQTGPEDQQTPSLPLIMSGSELADEVPPEAEPTLPAAAVEEDMTEVEEAVEEVDQAAETAEEAVEEAQMKWKKPQKPSRRLKKPQQWKKSLQQNPRRPRKMI